MKITTTTRTELAASYNVSLITFNKWLKKIEDLKIEANCRILTPKQVEIIFLHLGEPDK